MNLYLIGYRGCGKSTIAPLVAESLSDAGALWETVDADDAVEEIAGISIAEIFSKFGETKFRELESSCLLYTSPSPRDLSTSRMPSSA